MSLNQEDRQWILDVLGANVERLKRDLGEKLKEEIEGLETRLLRGFHDWASPRDVRQQSHSAAIRALDVEVEDLRRRLEKLETPQA